MREPDREEREVAAEEAGIQANARIAKRVEGYEARQRITEKSTGHTAAMPWLRYAW
jgi:hypothetical protein